ncbi:MAG: helix-turn-helix transcriptional regulator [Ruminococcus sp.]|nr:helix-turn-helix transcriptional regulator [Ruminococcus sp.]
MSEFLSDDKRYDIRRPDIKRIESLMQSGSLESCESVLASVLEETHFHECDSLMVRLYICMDIYISAQSFARTVGISGERFAEEFGSADELQGRLQTSEEAAELLCRLLKQCVKWRIESAHDNSFGIVYKAKDHIDNNYMDENISLRSVAEAVGLSPSYLSALFKREIGQNLSEYLTNVRIRRSKELLCCTSKMIYEIAYDVGFRDYRYFSQIFKKYTGQTPRQFQSTANCYP